MPDGATIGANLARVQEQIAVAAARAGRDAAAIRLVAVTKTFPAETIRAAYECGLRDFGENRVQEFDEKRRHLDLPDARFHLIGHLQSNKASHAVEFACIQTVDSERLARRLEDAAAGAARRISVLIQVSMDDAVREGAERSGISEDGAEALARIVASLEHLELQGLMVLPPYTPDPEGARPYFRRLRELRGRLQLAGLSQVSELSMGMTHDFPIAIEEGATMLRIGTAIFGPRPAPVVKGLASHA
jgi:pyridoxal phosphate enzyme (YggS family)